MSNINLTNSISSLDPSILKIYPFKHFQIPNFLDDSDFNDIYEDLMKLESTKPNSEFKSSFGIKQEWKSAISKVSKLQSFFDFLASDWFLLKLKEVFSIPNSINLYPDLTYDGGGYVKSPPESFLSYHADFNFSSSINKFRSINVLYYVNKNYIRSNGGILHCLDSESKTVEVEILPEANKIFAFLTDDLAFHGVSKNSPTFVRRSFNIYYYTDAPLSQRQSKNPHKTIWMDFENHTH